ncbi:MAG: peptidylprolyl isomerase [Rickettsiales bacterium]|jgi:hypothetical protein|nr:peptidylprolyl isomerase [Rickettsiales bacterium]
MALKIGNIAAKLMLSFVSLTFILFGVINYFDTMGESNLLKINGEQISINSFMTFLNNKKNQVMQTLDSSSNIDFLNSQDFAQMSLNEFVGEVLFSNEVKKMHLIMPKKILYTEIYNNPTFRDRNGKFSIDLYKTILSQSDFTEELYMSYLNKYGGDNSLYNLVTSHNLVNDFSLQKIFEESNKNYIVDIYTSKNLNLTLEKISSSEIEKYYNENQIQFRIPEKRTYSYIEVDLNEYENNIKEKFSQLEDLTLSARNIDEIATIFNVKKQTTDSPIGVTSDFLTSQAGVFSDIIYENNNKYKIYYVEKIESEKFLSLEEATKTITDIITEERKIEKEEKILKDLIKHFKNGDKRDISLLRNNIKETKNVDVDKDYDKYDQSILKNLFKKKVGEYTEPFFDKQNKIWVFMLVKNIKQYEEDNNNFTTKVMLENIVDTSYKNSIDLTFKKYLYENNEIIVNAKILNNLLSE